MPLEDIYRDTDARDRELLDMAGLTPITDGGGIFCGVGPQHFAINGVTYRWPQSRGLKFHVPAGLTIGSFGSADLKQLYVRAFGDIAAACDFSAEYTPNEKNANFYVQIVRLDGKQGVLADHEIPIPNGGMEQTLRLRLDVSEAWVVDGSPRNGEIDLYRVLLHELLHGVGLGHAPIDRANPALIEPMYSPLVSGLQPRDVAELQRRYGKPKTEEGANGPVMPAILPLDVTVELFGQKYQARGTARAV